MKSLGKGVSFRDNVNARQNYPFYTSAIPPDSSNSLCTALGVSARQMIMIKVVHPILGSIYFWISRENTLVPAAEIYREYLTHGQRPWDNSSTYKSGAQLLDDIRRYLRPMNKIAGDITELATKICEPDTYVCRIKDEVKSSNGLREEPDSRPNVETPAQNPSRRDTMLNQSSFWRKSALGITMFLFGINPGLPYHLLFYLPDYGNRSSALSLFVSLS